MELLPAPFRAQIGAYHKQGKGHAKTATLAALFISLVLNVTLLARIILK